MGLFDRFRKKTGQSGDQIPDGRAPGRTIDADELQEKRIDAINKYLGDAPRVYHELVQMTPHIDIYVFEPSAAYNRADYMLLTDGMSDLQMTLPPLIPPQYGRAELIVYLKEPVGGQENSSEIPIPVAILQYLAMYPHRLRTWLSYNHSIDIESPGPLIVPGSKLSTCLLVSPLYIPEAFLELPLINGHPICYLMLTLITQAESEFMQQYGLDALLNKFIEANISVAIDPFRKCLITGR